MPERSQRPPKRPSRPTERHPQLAESPTRLPIPSGTTPRELIGRHGADILASDGMEIERGCMQHGTTSVFEHSLAVTAQATLIAQALRIPVAERELVRGSLLHDYFLYDWHVGDPSHRLHGFRHPGFACANAERDFGINDIERDMIRHHMFPLTPVPPTCREGAILCIADKVVATRETVSDIALRLFRPVRTPGRD